MERSGDRGAHLQHANPSAQGAATEEELRNKQNASSLAEQARADASGDGDAASGDGDAASGGVSARDPNRPTSEVLGEMSHQITRLVRDEVQLALAESRTKGKRLGLAAGMGGIAAVLGLLGAMALTATVIAAIALVLPTWLSALIVGAALVLAALVAAGGLAVEVRRARPPLPEETIDNVQEDIAIVKGHRNT
ncbi:phage holin family protein [Tomitella gaofuii]|uniref:phage holin family protein n=1 Tax=Tomitella gaofuii TaxID=2760083 RepID=UPI001C70FED4|nr:phage holin family protein [Tomitella gaofuii]